MHERGVLPLAVLVGLLFLRPAADAAQAAAAKRKGLTNPFFALCIGAHDAKRRTPREQAEMLRELGYAGVAHLWLKGVDERLKTLDDNGLKLFQIYVRANIDPKKPPYDPGLKEVIKLLKGRDTVIGLLVSGGKPSTPEGDPRAVRIIREIAGMAQQSGLRVALYPHTGDWLERVEDAVRVARKVDRKNVGVMFNLCHWLKVDDEKNLEPLLKLAMPRLFAVTINGADSVAARRAGWDRLIQSLDRGSFDIHGFLKTLKRLGYTGPIGLQCYGIRGDAREHLARSMAAWRELLSKIAAEQK